MTKNACQIQPTEALEIVADRFRRPDSDYPRTSFRDRAAHALRDLKRLSRTAFEQVSETAERVQQVTSCGWTTAYLNDSQIGDPWKGRRVPRAVIMLDCLWRIHEAETDRATA